MSWVLILNTGYIQKPPAVIGGYPSRAEAERAGELATAFDNAVDCRLPYYTEYLVIPGAAAAEPVGATQSSIEHTLDFTTTPMNKIIRTTKRFP